jgi:hypothetical protein
MFLFFGSLHRVDVAGVADVSEVNASIIFP